MRRVHRLSEQQRYEEAAAERDRLAALVRGVDRAQQVRALTARRGGGGRPAAGRGGLGAGVHPARPAGRAAPSAGPGSRCRPTVEALRATAEHVPARAGPGSAALPEETALLVRWLETPGTRLVSTDAGWALPVGGAARWSQLHLVEGGRHGASLWRVPGDVGRDARGPAARPRGSAEPGPQHVLRRSPGQRRPRRGEERLERPRQVGGDVGRAAACRPPGPARAARRRR